MSPKSEWQEFFDGHAPVYNENCFTKNTLAEVDFLIEALELKPGASVLDVGCGTGRHAIELARRGYCVTGVEISEGMLQQARRHAKAAAVQVHWRREDATVFEVDESFDGVICLCEGAFGLLSKGQDALGQPLAILRRVAASLRPAARCLFTVLNGYAMARRRNQSDVEQNRFDPLNLTEISICLPGPRGEERPLRERGFVPTELRLLFQMAGLEVEAIWGGTAGNWGHRPLELDEMEIMVLARKPAGPTGATTP
ncbi:MAG TPA: class I SAM-dependent methyltransferase [Verrucomicrobiota bacterium]|jgi:SAM-dependent methyltransferase|nr:class I SAM-dependent methyltransferase [Verrucomicrobiota bacterium]HRT08524.1 class I SAM-dependent methyltransferase [Candidatus Paceibacterota bacterium]